MEGPGLVCGRREASLRLPHVSLLRRTREVGVSSARRYSTITEGWEYDSTSAAGWVGISEGNDGGVRAGGTKAPGTALQ